MTASDRSPAADDLLRAFRAAGYALATPAILQPAEPFLDLSGEDIRKSLYLTSGFGGDDLCLRPDLTIPVAREYLASAAAGEIAGFCYCGPVFRHRTDAPDEFLQAGIESFGRADRAAADAEMLALAIDAAATFGVTDVDIRIGDVALFYAVIDALRLPPVWRRRLVKDFHRKISLAQDLEKLSTDVAARPAEYQGVLAALANSDRKAALALVTDMMTIAGAATLGGRSVAEIADRFLEQSTLKGGALPRDAVDILTRFLAISGSPDAAAKELRALATQSKLDITAALDAFEARNADFATRRIDVRTLHFSTAFGRGLDYYTGFEFELHRRGNGREPLVAGGRYDGLLTRLGSTTPIPAVGFSVWIDQLARGGAS